MRNLLFICAVIFGFIACEKPAGEGGTSVIEGQVYKIHTSADPFTGDNTDTLYYQLNSGNDVFIIYSSDESDVYDDKFETDWEGKYRFEYLRKGDYTIYTYADSTVYLYPDDIDNSPKITYDYPIFRHITISLNNSTNTLDNFIIEKNQ